MIVQTAKTLNCFDLARTSNNFHTKVYGIKITFQNIKTQETVIISGIIDDVIMTCTDNNFINNKFQTKLSNRNWWLCKWANFIHSFSI